jgi:hypothetical protein
MKKISDFAEFQCVDTQLSKTRGGQAIKALDEKVYTGHCYHLFWTLLY